MQKTHEYQEKTTFPLPEFESRTFQTIVYSLYHYVIPVYEIKYMKIKRKAEEIKKNLPNVKEQ